MFGLVVDGGRGGPGAGAATATLGSGTGSDGTGAATFILGADPFGRTVGGSLTRPRPPGGIDGGGPGMVTALSSGARLTTYRSLPTGSTAR
jgi:hypothetical protein